MLANRLPEYPKIKVLVLEAGGADNSLLVRMPAGVGWLLTAKGDYNWGFWTEPEPTWTIVNCGGFGGTAGAAHHRSTA